VTVYVYFHNLCGYCEFMYFIDFSFQICCLCYSCYSVLTNFFHGYDLLPEGLLVLVEEYLKKLHPCSR
jgi:hypothetical protein